MESNESINVLVSCFACGPNWGSEVGMGWNWIINLADHCHLHVITEKGFQKEIETEIVKLNLVNPPKFYYIDIGDFGRKLFWKQGSLWFYFHYGKWQRTAFKQALKIIESNEIQLIHQLNLIGFREPGYLWKLSRRKPVIWGPVGGFNQVPFNYILKFSLKNKAFYFGKNLIHFFQVYFDRRVRNAFANSTLVLAESTSTKKIIKKVFGIDTILMNETGADFKDFYQHPTFCNNNTLNLLWVGKIQGLKSLPIALMTMKKVQGKVPVKLSIVGDGPDEISCKQFAINLGIDDIVCFLGKKPNKEVKELMKVHDLLFFTSLKEGTPHVVLEALSNGLPVLCHDACGHGDIINDSIGIKIPMESHFKSVELFAEKIQYLNKNPSRLVEFSKNTREYVETYSWENKTKKMIDIYQSVINDRSVIQN
jgi:glycosyltransferase involved in cell wall biosynthesis